MHFLRHIANSRCAACGPHFGLGRLFGYGRAFLLVLWAIGVLAFCVLGLASAMR